MIKALQMGLAILVFTPIAISLITMIILAIVVFSVF